MLYADLLSQSRTVTYTNPSEPMGVTAAKNIDCVFLDVVTGCDTEIIFL